MFGSCFAHRAPLAIAALLLATACDDPNEPSTSPQSPNSTASVDLRTAAAGSSVLLITLDTTRADHLGCYGSTTAETPNLDRLAAGGLLFERALTTAPITLPAHTSLMTGQLPIDHGIRDNGKFRVADEVDLLAEKFQRAGYATAGFISAHVLAAVYGIAQGFEHFDEALSMMTGGVERVERRAGATVDATLAWLDAAPAQPRFVWVHLFDPHHPYEPPGEFRERFAANPYDGEIAYLDRQLGRLLRRWDQQDGANESLIVLTADHGEGLSEHEEATHGLFIYDATMRVPLILRAGWLGPPRHIDGQVSIISIAPTLIDLYALEGSTDGSLLAPLSSGATEIWRDVYLETQLTRFTYGLAPLEAICDREYKYIEAPLPELYHWTDDPGELTNLYATEPDLVSKLRERLTQMRGDNEVLDSAPPRELSEEDRARLRALGYLGQGTNDFAGADPKTMLPVLNAQARAVGLLQANRLDEAIRVLERVLEKVPANATALAMIGQAHLGQGDLDAAERNLLACLQFRPDMTGGWQNLGRLYETRKSWDDAVDAYRELIQLAPSSGEAWEAIARCALQASGPQAAIELLEQGLSKVPAGSRYARRLEQWRQQMLSMSSESVGDDGS